MDEEAVLRIAQAALAHSHLEQVTSIHKRLTERGGIMSSDVREILYAIAFSHQDAASALLKDAQEG